MHFKTTLALFFAAVAIASPVAEPAEQEAQSAQEGQEAEWPGRFGGGWGRPHGRGGWGWGARWCQRDWNSCIQNCNNGYSAFGGNYGCYNQCDSSHCSLRNSRFF